jgi:hypothetical protein
MGADKGVLGRRITAAGALGVALSLAGSPAFAADGVGSLTTAQAREAAARIGCGAPRVARYYARTLRVIDRQRWGSLGDAARADAIDAAADAVYLATRSGNAAADPFAALFGKSKARDACSPAELDAAVVAIDRADTARAESDVDRCAAAPPDKLRADPACIVAMAARAALEGDHERAVGTMADLLALTTFAKVYDGNHLSPADRATLLENIARGLRATATGDDERAIDEPLAHAFHGLDLDAVRPEACKDDEPLARLWSGGSLRSQEAFCAATRTSLALDKVPVTLRGPAGERSTDLDALLRAAHASRRAEAPDEAAGDDALVEQLLCMLPGTPGDKALADCATGRLVAKKPASYKVIVGGLAWSVEITPDKDGASVHVASGDHETLSELLDGARSVAQLRHDLAFAVRDHLLGREPKPEELRELAVAAGRTWALAEELAAAATGEEGGADLVSFVEWLPPRTAAQCVAPASPLDALACATAPGSGARRLLAAAGAGDLRGVALEAASAALRSDDRAQCSASVTHGRLLVATAERVGGGDAVDDLALADAQLASAVRDVTTCASSAGRADTRADARLVTFDLLPTPGLRVAYSTGFTNGVGGDGLRVLPSLEWLAARVRLSGPGARAYVGLQGTLLDPVAPLAELAMRRADLVFDNQGLAWLDVLRPRVELAFGVPAFGDHVLLTAGASLRAAAPFFGGKTFNPLAPPQTDRMIYLTPFHADPRARDDFARFVEVGAGARYVF